MAADRPAPIYVFRDQSFSGGGDTVVCVAPVEAVQRVFGAEGPFGSDGLSKAFDGCAVFRDDASGQQLLGVWGARKASRFRNRLRANGILLDIKHERPPGKCVLKLYGNIAKAGL